MISRSVLIRAKRSAEAGLLGWSRIGAQAVQARGRVPALAAVSGPAVGLVVVDSSLFDTCRTETYRRQRNSCWSRCTRAISPAYHLAGKLLSPDRPEHRRRNQCTQ